MGSGWVYCLVMERTVLKIFGVVFSAFLFSGCQTIEPNTGWDGGYKVGQVFGEKTSGPESSAQKSYNIDGRGLSNYSDEYICGVATVSVDGKARYFIYDGSEYSGYLIEARRRGLTCGVKNHDELQFAKLTDNELCDLATKTRGDSSLTRKTQWDSNASSYVAEAKRRGLNCGVNQGPTNAGIWCLAKYYHPVVKNKETKTVVWYDSVERSECHESQIEIHPDQINEYLVSEVTRNNFCKLALAKRTPRTAPYIDARKRLQLTCKVEQSLTANAELKAVNPPKRVNTDDSERVKK